MDLEGLLSREDGAWSELTEALEAVPVDRRQVESVVPGWSAHDMVWHTAYWADWARDAMERIREGRPEREEPEDDAAWEAEILAAGRAVSWDEAMVRLGEERLRARAALESFDGDLPEGAIEWFTDDTINHYREHAGQIRAFIG